MQSKNIKLTDEQAQRVKACRSVNELHDLMEELGYSLKDSEARAFAEIMKNDERFRKTKKDAIIGKLPKWHDPGPE